VCVNAESNALCTLISLFFYVIYRLIRAQDEERGIDSKEYKKEGSNADSPYSPFYAAEEQ